MLHGSRLGRLTLCLMTTVCMFAAQCLLALQPTHAAERYERKSISFINEILTTPSAEEMPANRASELTKEIRKQIEDEMPRFDYNDLPGSFLVRFRERSRTYLSQKLQSVDSLNISIRRTEQSMADVSRTILRQEGSGGELLLQKSKSDQQWKRYRELSEHRKALIKRRRAAENDLFKQVAGLMTETVAPGLVKVLSDPELQRFRAREYVDEVERNRFIVEKANELGITSEDLEKVMDSAYLYIILLTDYSRTEEEHKTPSIEKHKKPDRIVTYSLSGGIVWFKLAVSPKPDVQTLKMVGADASASGTLGVTALGSGEDSDTHAFRQAAKKFAGNLKLETCKIDDFATAAVIVEVSGSKVSFPLGKKEGLRVDQKFSVYEKREISDKIQKKKRGFLYVYQVGDNISERDKLSYGKLVVRGAEPGMQVREYPAPGIDLSFRFRLGEIKVDQESLPEPEASSVNTDEEVRTQLRVLNCTLQYDIGRVLRIPQLFATLGSDFGLPSIRDPNEKVPGELYLDIDSYYGGYAGFLKKFYISRIALFFEPLVQFQWLNIDCSDGTHFEDTALSFAPNVGLEIAIRENINVGVVLNYRIQTLGKDSAGNLPETLLGMYLSYSVPSLW